MANLQRKRDMNLSENDKKNERNKQTNLETIIEHK